MLIRPGREDARIIGYYLGKLVLGLAALLVVPLVVAIALGEWNDVTALAVGIAVAVAIGSAANWRLATTRDLTMASGLVTVALAWLVAPAVVSIPFYLSGHFGSFTDAFYDAMSGLTTSGLALVQDLDHVTVPINLLRHLTHFAGGQGIVVVVLTMLSTSSARIGTLYVGEGRDDQIVPNVVRTARFIYLIATAYLLAGTAALWVTSLLAGLSPGRALFHAVTIFMGAFDTGGFAPYSSSMAYYHSASMEAVVVVLMIAGTVSFGLHHQLWRGRRRALVRDLETRTLGTTLVLTLVVACVGLARAGTLTDPVGLLRKGVFTVVSAHSGTGFAVNAPRLFVTDWGPIAPAAIVLAMVLGGMASSTAGGFKAIRVGLIAKAVARDVRRAVQPDAAVTVATRTGLTRQVITDGEVRAAISIVVLYMLAHLAGALLGVYFDYPFDEALFESTSTLANVGLSVGVTAPSMPYAMKVFAILQMWLGRLEFMAGFALVGWLYASWRGRG